MMNAKNMVDAIAATRCNGCAQKDVHSCASCPVAAIYGKYAVAASK